jgi:hypothetical protein
MTTATKPTSNGGGGLPPVIEREDGGDGRHGPTGDDWVRIAEPPPAGWWVVELRPRFAILNWEGPKQDGYKIPELPLVAANRAMLIRLKRDTPIALPRMLDEQTFSGDSKWAVSPLEPSGQYAIADDGSVLWCDEGNTDPAPKLPARRKRRKLRNINNYSDWQFFAKQCFDWRRQQSLCEYEEAFLRDIITCDDGLTDKQWKFLKRIYARMLLRHLKRDFDHRRAAKAAKLAPTPPRRRRLLTG